MSAEIRDDEAPLLPELMQLLHQQWRQPAVYVAARLGIADLLADGSHTVSELAGMTGAHAPSLYRLLRALARIGIFTELDGLRFANSELSSLLRCGVPGSLAAMTMTSDLMRGAFGELLHSVQTGEPGFEKAYGVPMWQYLAERDRVAGSQFHAAMTQASTAVNLPIAQAADLSGVRSVVDVGGGEGGLLRTILATYPEIERGILFDQPYVIDGVRAARGCPVEERLQLAGGDFFTAVPAGADVYVMKAILHDWDDAACRQLLSSCRRAMTSHSRLLAVELVVDPARSGELAYGMDLHMLVALGGKERTAAEFRELYEAAGLRLNRIIPAGSMVSLVEGLPQGNGGDTISVTPSAGLPPVVA